MNKIKNTFNNFAEKMKKFFSFIDDKFFYFIQNYDFYIYFVVITILSLAIRISVFDCIRGDFVSFLKPWYTSIYEQGFSRLGENFGDYTPAYYYFLYFISLFKIDPESLKLLYGIKIISCIFDYLLAIYIYKGILKLTNNKIKALIGYSFTLFGITIFLNSALWGQCDAIYTFFVVSSLFYMLEGKQRTSMILYGGAFCFKIQSIFILPVYIILWLRRNFKFRYFIWIFIVYVLVSLPACFASNNFFNRFGEILSIFFNQAANSYTQLTLNAGSFYALIFTNFKDEEFISSFSVILAIMIIGTYIFFIFRSKEKISKEGWVKIATLFSLVFPYFLPHMHERYFYIADVLVIVYVILNPKKFYVAILAIANSMIGYMIYLWNIPFLDPIIGGRGDDTKPISLRFGAILYLIAIIIISKDVFKDLYPSGLENENIKKEETI